MEDRRRPAAQERSSQQQRLLHALLVAELDAGKVLGPTGVLLHQDSTAADLSARRNLLYFVSTHPA